MHWLVAPIHTFPATLPSHAPPLQTSLTSVAWAYGAVVRAELDSNGNMAATLDFKRIWRGTPLNLGPLVTISYPRDRCWKGWCHHRVVEITVRPFIKIAISQAWVPAGAGAPGSWADALEV